MIQLNTNQMWALVALFTTQSKTYKWNSFIAIANVILLYLLSISKDF